MKDVKTVYTIKKDEFFYTGFRVESEIAKR